MPTDDVLANQQTIISNQQTIIANQEQIKNNQAKLDEALANQERFSRIRTRSWLIKGNWMR